MVVSPTRQELHAAINTARRELVMPHGADKGGRRTYLRLAGLPCPGGWSSETGYNHHGCRCDGCREAHRVARQARYARRVSS